MCGVGLSPADWGSAAALYRADGLSAVDTAADTVERQSHAGDVGRTLRGFLAVRSAFDGLSERFLVLQSLCVANAVRVRRLVRARRRQKDVASSVFTDHAVDCDCLSVGGVLRDSDLVLPAAGLPDAALACAVDLSHQQHRY